jgi:hypothetical protein
LRYTFYMGLFGTKPEGKTFLILDIETGSVGGALAHVDPHAPPRLFGESRIELAAGATRDAYTLRERASRAILSIARGLAEVAYRLRGHEATARMGSVSRAAAFFAAPWGVPDLAAGRPTIDTDLKRSLEHAVDATFEVPTHIHARASAGLGGIRALLPYEDTYLICMPGGEITEVLSVESGVVRSSGTIPAGRHTLLRTLVSHAGLTEEEARSALHLRPAHLREPLHHAAQHVSGHFSSLALEHGWHGHRQIYSLAHEGDWFARALAESPAAKLFAPDSAIRHIRNTHVSPLVALHAPDPDLALMLGALFVDSHYR